MKQSPHLLRQAAWSTVKSPNRSPNMRLTSNNHSNHVIHTLGRTFSRYRTVILLFRNDQEVYCISWSTVLVSHSKRQHHQHNARQSRRGLANHRHIFSSPICELPRRGAHESRLYCIVALQIVYTSYVVHRRKTSYIYDICD
jgi:hypothetical protein